MLIVFFNLPIEQVKSAKETSCVVNAFVLATPISGPAWVKKIKSESLVRLDSAELVIHRVFILVFIFLQP